MYKHLTSEQRYGIFALLATNATRSFIAKIIGVSISTVSREIKRNSCNDNYSHKEAQQLADIRKQHCAGNRHIKDEVKQRILYYLTEEQWSPRQISGYLKNTENIQVSHEYIYQIVRADKQAGGTLYTHLRHRGKHRKRPVGKCSNIPDRISIHERPKEADGTRLGDWELDTIVGKNGNGAIVTLVERKTNYLLMKKSPKGKDAETVAKIVTDLLLPYKHLVKTITTDNGSEFRHHRKISKALGVTVYFADPYSSWQKGCIENTNKLIRQYIPKGTDFEVLTDQQILQIQYKINRRPRAKLNFMTPRSTLHPKIPAPQNPRP